MCLVFTQHNNKNISNKSFDGLKLNKKNTLRKDSERCERWNKVWL